jgi:cation transporter-like permease
MGVVCAIVVNFILMAQLSLRLAHLRWRSFLYAHAAAFPLAIVVGFEAYFLVNLLRFQQMSAFQTVLTSTFVIGLTTLLIGFFAKRAFIGQDVLWMLNSLVFLLKREPQESKK